MIRAINEALYYSVSTSALGGFLKIGCSLPSFGLVNIVVFQVGAVTGPVPLN